MAREPASSSSLVARVAAVLVLGLSCTAAMNAYATVAAGADWLAAWTAASALYTVVGAGLWRRTPWARSLGLGVVLWGLLAWVQSMFAGLGFHPLLLGIVGGHAVVAALLALCECGLEPRHRWSLLLAGAALPGALMYGFAPLADPQTRVMLVGGAGLLFAMAVGLSRGRTWGLLAALPAVPMLCTGAFVAPAVVPISLMHPLLAADLMPHGVLMLRFLGVSAAVLACASVLPFAGPVARFLRGTPAS
ncbi:MAG: hypothetical protein ACRBN8_35255 [Nannocystales bacterium]